MARPITPDFRPAADAKRTGPAKSAPIPATDATVADKVRTLLVDHEDTPGALLPLLHDVQEAFGYIPAEAVPLLADGLNLSRAEVHGVISFYHDFRTAPPGRHLVRICRAESCQACGGVELVAQAERLLGCPGKGTRPDGAVTMEPVYCLGLCASSPAMEVDGVLHARVTSERLARILAGLGGGKP